MLRLAFWLAAVPAIAIIVIGSQYVFRPSVAVQSFGLPLPESRDGTAPWLRLKGVRDLASGTAVLAIMGWGNARCVGILLLALALIPVGDMLTILAANGSTRTAFGVHGLTALAMVVVAGPLVFSGA